MNNVALIPARSGSKRIQGKNIKLLNGHPLIAYTIDAVLRSGVFSRIIVSTDSLEIAGIAKRYGAEVPGLRPKELAEDSSPDIEWVNYAINNWLDLEHEATLAILRPTSPLRRPVTLVDALAKFKENSWADSLRAMEKVSQHPGKMWRVDSNFEATPFIEQLPMQTPTHSMPTQSLELLHVQNASLEITSVKSVLDTKTIAGNRVLAYQMPEKEGFDLNTDDDWLLLNSLINSNKDLIPKMEFKYE